MNAEHSTPVASTPAAGDEPLAGSPTRADAVSQLFREHNRALVNFLLTRLPDEQEAKEVAQEACVKLLRLDQPVAAGILRWYLFKIARDLAIDRQRQSTTRGRLDRLDMSDDFDLSNPTESRAIAADELARLLAALRELPQKCQHAFLLQRFHGLSTLEVAKRMKLTDRMVRHYVKRALVYSRFRLEAGVKMGFGTDLLGDQHTGLINQKGGLFQAEAEKFVTTPIYHVFEMYAAHQGGQSLRTMFETPSIHHEQDGKSVSIGGLQGSASIQGHELTLTVVNPHLSEPAEPRIVIHGGEVTAAMATTLSHTDIHAQNTFDTPQQVKPVVTPLKVKGSTFHHRFPPASVSRLALHLIGG